MVKLASNQDSHKISDEFDFGPDQIIQFRVICPWVTKILRKTIAPRLRFKFWSDLRYLQVTWISTWAYIKSRTCLTWGRIGTFTSELFALVWRKFCGKWYTLANALVVILSSLNLQGIRTCINSFIIRFWTRSDYLFWSFILELLALEWQTISLQTFNGKNVVPRRAPSFLIGSLSNLRSYNLG